uniref:Cadherin domain-containing protein n=1 Tax=Gongylonema pulchrum TaxID=637853 RepID=A0A183EN28_9BILA
LASRVRYRHDNSETTVDNIDLEVEILSKRTDDEAPKLRSTIYSIPVRINPVNDAPNLKPGINPEALLISGESK